MLSDLLDGDHKIRASAMGAMRNQALHGSSTVGTLFLVVAPAIRTDCVSREYSCSASGAT